MALSPEFGKTSYALPHTDLRSEATVKRLLKQGRYPSVLAFFGDEHYDRAQIFVPPGKSSPSESFTVSLDEARKIVAIRSKLERQH